jgi:hypothetical protein
VSNASTGYSLTGVQVQDEGSNLGLATFLDFTGAGVTASASGSVITVNIPGGGGGGGVNSVSVDAGELTDTGTASDPVLGLATTAVAAGSYTYTSLTVDAFGRLTAAANGTAPVTSVSVDAGELTNTGTATAPVLGLATTAVVAGSYTYTSLTVDAFGRLTAASNGVAPVASGWTDGGTVVYLTTTTDDVSIGSNTPVTSRKVSVYNTGTDLGMSVVTLASTDNVLETFVTGEANLRWNVLGSGAMRWGAGGASALDARLYRSGTSTLTVDNTAGGSAVFSVLGRTVTQTRAVQTTTQTGAYAVAATDDVIFVNPTGGSFDVTLPNANVVTGRRVQVKRIVTSANVVTVKSAGGTIDGVAAGTGIALAGGSLNAITVVSDGTNWWII